MTSDTSDTSDTFLGSPPTLDPWTRSPLRPHRRASPAILRRSHPLSPATPSPETPNVYPPLS